MTSKSISSPKRIWFITGGKGSGKSTAACRFARPSEIEQMVVFDTEDSLSDILEQNERLGVSFGAYIRGYERFKFTDDMLDAVARGKLPWVSDKKKKFALVGYWEWFVQVLSEKLKPEHRYLVIDTIQPIEAAAAAWAEVNKKLSGWTGKMAYGGLEVEAVRPLLNNTFEAISRRGITDILITAHTKTPWIEYAPRKSRPMPGKIKPGSRLKLWSPLSVAMFWLVRPPYPPNEQGIPSAIVLKARAGDAKIDEGADEWVTSSLIPPRIPAFTWQAWRQYKQTGWNPMAPQPGETLLSAEERMMSELLSDAEHQLMILGAQIVLQGEQQESVPLFARPAKKDDDPMCTAGALNVLLAQGKTPEEIAVIVGKPLPVVRKLLGRMK